jgi:hypothetical protein
MPDQSVCLIKSRVERFSLAINRITQVNPDLEIVAMHLNHMTLLSVLLYN